MSGGRAPTRVIWTVVAAGAVVVLLCCGGVVGTVFTAAQQGATLTACGLAAPDTSTPGAALIGTPAPGTPAPGTQAPRAQAPGTQAPGTSAPGTSAPGNPTIPAGDVTLPTEVGPFRGEQLVHAATIVTVGRERGVPTRGWVVALATAMQESTLRNLEGGDRDSLGLFQQRPSKGWGTREQILDTRYASTKFYERLVTVPRWETMRVTDAAQAVQRSGLPGAYQKWEPLANSVLSALLGPGVLEGLGGAACAGFGALSVQGWTNPTPGRVGSGFRTASRPGHDGVDISVSKGTTIRAAAAGYVVVAMCQASTGNCDVDGSPRVRGCGWYVEIDHADGTMTRYCHMQQRPSVAEGQQVAAGQAIGLIGSSGNSSGPHLHFETHIGGDAVDPEAFMTERGAPLGVSPA